MKFFDIKHCLYLFVFASLALFVKAEDLGPMLSGYIPANTDYDSAWSVFVGGDFSVQQGAAELEGRVFVRNDMTLSIPSGSGYNVGVAVGAGVHPPDDSEVLVVGGDLLGSGKFIMENYRARVEKTVASGIIWQDLGLLYTGGVDFASADLLIADLQQKSAYWGSLSGTSGGSYS